MRKSIAQIFKTMSSDERAQTLLAFDGFWSTEEIRQQLSELKQAQVWPGCVLLYRSHCSPLLAEFENDVELGNECLFENDAWKAIDDFVFPLSKQW